LLRASLLALLVLGLAVKPAVTLVGAAHAMEHALAAEVDDHDHDHDEHPEATPEERPASDHADGVHGLMHQGAGGGASSDGIASVMPVAVVYAPLALPARAPLRVPRKHSTGPFRPPIA